MSKFLEKEKNLVIGFVSNTATKPTANNGKKRKIFTNHSVNEGISSTLHQSTNEEDIYVSPIVGTFKVTAKFRIGGKIEPLPVDNEEIVYLYE
jgi:hypothetical protein